MKGGTRDVQLCKGPEKGTQSLNPPRARLAVWVPQGTPREPLVQLMHHCDVAVHLRMGEVRGLRELHRTFWMGWALFTENWIAGISMEIPSTRVQRPGITSSGD